MGKHPIPKILCIVYVSINRKKVHYLYCEKNMLFYRLKIFLKSSKMYDKNISHVSVIQFYMSKKVSNVKYFHYRSNHEMIFLLKNSFITFDYMTPGNQNHPHLKTLYIIYIFFSLRKS